MRSLPTLCLFALTFVACQSNFAVPVESKHLIGFTLESPGHSFPTDSALQLKSFGYLADGSRVDLTNVTGWTSSQPSIARIGDSGIVSLIGVGTARIEGRYEDRLVVLSMEATAAQLVSLELSASSEGLLALGDSRRFQAIGIYSDGKRLDLTERAIWRTDSVHSQVTDAGNVVARSEGMALVAARFGGREVSMNFEVTRARMTGLRLQSFLDRLNLGELRQLKVFATYSDGSEREVTAEARWSSSESAIEFVSQPGMVLGSAIGHSLITAEFDGVVSVLTLSVHEKRLVSLEMERSTLSIAKGLQAPIRVFARFDDRSNEDVASEAQWSSSDPSVATVGFGGVIETHTEGVATLTAMVEGHDASLVVTVGAPVVVRITPTFAGGRMVVNQATTLQVIGVMSDGTFANVSSAVRVTHGSQLFTDLLGDRLELRALPVGNPALAHAVLTLEFGQFSHQVQIAVTNETVTNISLQRTTQSVRPDQRATRFRAIASWSDGVQTDVSELGSWWIDDPTVVELHDEPGRRGFFTLGRGGKAEIHFVHPEQDVMVSWDFDPQP